MTSAKAAIRQGLEHIEQNLQDEALTPQALAAHCGYSYSHFCHIFKLFCGCTVGDYLRQRRLTAAANELLTGGSVTDTALKWGFATPAGFTKAFIRQYGLSPQAYKLSGAAVITTPLLPEIITPKDVCAMLKEKFVERAAFKVAGYAVTKPEGVDVDIRTNGAWWQDQTFTQPSAEAYAAYAEDRDQIGIWWHVNADNTGDLYYLFGVVADDSKEMPEGMAVAEISAATYAVFETEPVSLKDTAAFAEAVRALWHKIYAEELEANGLELDPMGAAFEVYSSKNGGFDDDTATTEIWVPVRK